MALRGAAARRYAQAAFSIAKDTNTLDRWLSDLTTLAGIFGNEHVVSVLEDPKLTYEEQRGAIHQLVPKDVVSELALNMVMLLMQRDRLSSLPRILETFQEMYNKEKGIVVAEVTTAVPLDDAHRERVQQHLSQITGKTVELRVRHDPSILGGMITRIGDELLDASVASRLAELGDRLT